MSAVAPSSEDVQLILSILNKLMRAEHWILDISDAFMREISRPPMIFDTPDIGFKLLGYRDTRHPGIDPEDDYANIVFETVSFGCERGGLLDSDLNWNIEIPMVNAFSDERFSYLFHAIWDEYAAPELKRFGDVDLLQVEVSIYDGMPFEVSHQTLTGIPTFAHGKIPSETHEHYWSMAKDIVDLYRKFLAAESWLRTVAGRFEAAYFAAIDVQSGRRLPAGSQIDYGLTYTLSAHLLEDHPDFIEEDINENQVFEIREPWPRKCDTFHEHIRCQVGNTGNRIKRYPLNDGAYAPLAMLPEYRPCRMFDLFVNEIKLGKYHYHDIGDIFPCITFTARMWIPFLTAIDDMSFEASDGIVHTPNM